jgi:tetratricopeptide (TPR) repeat protein
MSSKWRVLTAAVALFLLKQVLGDTGNVKAKVLLDAGNYAEAAKLYRQVLQSAPADVLAQTGLGMALNAMGQYREAIVPLSKAVEADPRNTPVLRELIRAFVGSNSFSEAEQFLGLLLKADRQDKEGWYLFGVLLLQNGYYTTAERAFSRAIEPGAPPGKANVYRAVCQLHSNQQREAKAAFISLAAQSQFANDLDLLLGYAQLSYETGEIARAETLSGKAASLSPANPEAALWHARSLARLGRWREAVASAERALALTPDRPQTHNLLLRIYQQLGNASLAEREAVWLRNHNERLATAGKQ